ncbi:hypothetical protein BV394_00390 [Brevirhabdus pacifica]|uniref:Uncharacterized protein n=1 Tax=Brevirhabdus pacifica TaxID=1267768 RepID=A0A1U7DES2_9RHOB|nr:rcc01693 family protein [Brevirhabdus pacifica]APX88378.1 hypothetical protein BV394_00390 [Brevirhabdus pacifica]PJJ87167.1 putative phage protein (TIGR02216 family) [Brevirhabdus pacifica]
MSGDKGPGGSGAFDWPELMRAGCRELGLRPWDFWRLTPAELTLLLGGGSGAPAAGVVGRARLDELARLYPDHGGMGE